MKKLKKILAFKSEKEERVFWQSVDSTDYVSYASLRRARFPNLQLTSKPITIRLPVSMIERLKIQAHKRDIPYQAFMKELLYSGLSKL